jgi:hypothetical protein
MSHLEKEKQKLVARIKSGFGGRLTPSNDPLPPATIAPTF